MACPARYGASRTLQLSQDEHDEHTSSSSTSLKSRLPYEWPSSGGLSGRSSFKSSSRLRFLFAVDFVCERQGK